MKTIRVSLIQFRIEPERSKESTFEHARKLFNIAFKEEAQIVCLPERWNYRKGTIEENIEPYNGQTITFLQKVSEETGLYIIGGAIWVYNQDKTECQIISGIFNPKGELMEIQQKLHLYLYEKSYFKPGEKLKIINTEFGKIGIVICFDMIFPEIARFYGLNDVDIIFSPVLIREEGIENWHIYLKARALENRMPICAVNCVGRFSDRNYPGESLLIDFKPGFETPSRLRIRQAPQNKEVVFTDLLDLETAQKLKKKRLAERIEIDNRIFRKIRKND